MLCAVRAFHKIGKSRASKDRYVMNPDNMKTVCGVSSGIRMSRASSSRPSVVRNSQMLFEFGSISSNSFSASATRPSAQACLICTNISPSKSSDTRK